MNLPDALNLASKGFRVVPLHSVMGRVCSCPKGAECGSSAGKHPRINNWQTEASCEATVVREWFARWPNANVGLAMGGWRRHVALDVDGAAGRVTLAKLESEYAALPDTLTSRTGRDEGGEHRIFRVPVELNAAAIPNGVGRAKNSRHPGIDVRAEGGQIAVAPSVHYTGRRYEWTTPAGASAGIAELPEWLFELLAAGRETPADEPEDDVQPVDRPTFPQTVPTADRITRASRYLATIEPAIQGSHGGTHTFMVAQKIGRGFDLDQATCFAMLRDEFNPRCVPEWELSDLRRKVKQAYEKGTFEWGKLLKAELPPRTTRAHQGGASASGGVTAPRVSVAAGASLMGAMRSEDERKSDDCHEVTDEQIADDAASIDLHLQAADGADEQVAKQSAGEKPSDDGPSETGGGCTPGATVPPAGPPSGHATIQERHERQRQETPSNVDRAYGDEHASRAEGFRDVGTDHGSLQAGSKASSASAAQPAKLDSHTEGCDATAADDGAPPGGPVDPPPPIRPAWWDDDDGGSSDGPPDSLRDRIQLTSDRLDLDTDRACRALRRDTGIYQRDGELVQVVRIAETDPEAGKPDADGKRRGHFVPGTPTIRAMQVPTLTERLARCAGFLRFDARSKDDPWRPCHPPKPVVAAVAARGEWQHVRPVVGVLESPSMRPDGSIIQEPGYDPATGYLYQPNATFLPVADKPTQDDANAALAALVEVWEEFPWQKPAMRFVPVAALLTLLARPAIAGAVPAFLFDASSAGSGKTKTANTISIIATGRDAAQANWPDDEVELEKVLGAYALRAASMISFDNVTKTFGGGPIDRVLTATDRVELRILGTSEIPSLKWRAVILATGNNMALGSDTTRRVLVARIEPNVERPQDRTGFRHDPLEDWCRTERPRLVQAALTVLRAYVAAGRPDVGVRTWGSFEPWTRLVACALAYAGGVAGSGAPECDVLACQCGSETDSDSETSALRTILQEWPGLAGDGMTAKQAIDLLYPLEQLRGKAPPDDYGGLREAIEQVVSTKPGSAPSPAKLAYRFRAWKGRIVGGRKMVSQTAGGGVMRWLAINQDGSRIHPNHPHHPNNLKVIDGGESSGDRGDGCDSHAPA